MTKVYLESFKSGFFPDHEPVVVKPAVDGSLKRLIPFREAEIDGGHKKK